MNESKQAIINGLKNIKVVIGNGFDLHCNLHTSYNDFFAHPKREGKYKEISKWIEDLKRIYEEDKEYFYDNISDFHFENANVWDFFFVLTKFNGNPNWSDVEKLIEVSLQRRPGNAQSVLIPVHWPYVCDSLHKANEVPNYFELALMKYVTSQRIKILNNGNLDFYHFLLNELMLFETDFGNFIARKIIYRNSFMTRYNDCYLENALETIKSLTNLSNISSIDSFNYGCLPIEGLSKKIYNVNGDFNKPIFGIDSNYKPSDDCFIFTKASRKLLSDFYSPTHYSNVPFKDVVIYGHSLDKADYNYFFPLFDQMELLNNLKDSKLVFAFSIYDRNKRDKIISEYEDSICNLIYSYAKYKNLNEPSRLLDTILNSSRLIIYQLDNHMVEIRDSDFMDE